MSDAALEKKTESWKSIDLLQRQNPEPLFGLIREIFTELPELCHFNAIPVEQTEECNLMDASWGYDKQKANEFAWGPGMALAQCTKGHLKAAFQNIAIQTWYGKAADPKGFSGIMSYLNSFSVPTVINAGGSAANDCTSVFAVSHEHLNYIWGNAGKITGADLIEMVTEKDADGKPKEQYKQKIHIYIGFRIVTPEFLGRICNIDADHPVTDTMLDELVGSLGSKFHPDAFYMTRQARTMLQKSRTVDDETPVPIPVEYRDVPIYVTEAISNTEPVLN